MTHEPTTITGRRPSMLGRIMAELRERGLTDIEPAPAELDGAALWAVIRDHAFNDTQWWRKVNRRRDHAQLNTYVQRGPGHTPTR